MAYGLDPITDFGPAPLERYRAGLGEYLGAIADEGSLNPLPSLLRWGQRFAREHGEDMSSRRALEEGFEAFGMGRGEDLGFATVPPKLPREEVARRAKEFGLALDRPMTEETLESIVAERRRRVANQLVFDRAAMGTSGQTLGVLAEFLVTAADPLNVASAFIPFTRAPLVAARLAQIGTPGAQRLARGAIEGALGNLAVEPFVALAALDEDPQYGVVNWLLTAAFGAGLGGGLHWLAGRFRPDEAAGRDARQEASLGRSEASPEAPLGRDQEAATQRAEAPPPVAPPPAPERASAPPYEVRAVNEQLAAKVPQETARLVDQAAPETRDAALQVATAQVLGADRRPDVGWLFEADGRFVAARAAYAEETRFRQELRVSIEELRTRQRLQESELARLRAETFRFRPPEDFKPSKAAIAEAKALKAGKAPGRKVKEPQSLAQFVRDKGGIDVADTLAGDLRGQDLGGLSGLLRIRREGGIQKDLTRKKLGRSADAMGEAAWQEGFYHERPTAEQLIADLIDDAAGARKTYADMDQFTKWEARQREEKLYDEWLDSLETTGLDLAKYDERTLAYILSLDPARQKVIALEEAFHAGKLGEDEALEVALRLENEMAAAQAEAIAEARARVQAQRPEAFDPDLEARPAEDYTPLTREEFDAVDTELRRLEERGELAPHIVAEPEAGRAGAAGLARGAPDEFEPSALAAQFPQARITTEARIDPETLAAFARRQEDIANDLHAAPDAAARSEAYVADRQTTDIVAETAEVEALARPLLTDADKASIAEKDAAYRDEKAMIDAFAACNLGGGA